MELRLTTAGESHGPGLTCIVEGLPAGLELSPEDLNRDMARRQGLTVLALSSTARSNYGVTPASAAMMPSMRATSSTEPSSRAT